MGNIVNKYDSKDVLTETAQQLIDPLLKKYQTSIRNYLDEQIAIASKEINHSIQKEVQKLQNSQSGHLKNEFKNIKGFNFNKNEGQETLIEQPFFKNQFTDDERNNNDYHRKGNIQNKNQQQKKQYGTLFPYNQNDTDDITLKNDQTYYQNLRKYDQNYMSDQAQAANQNANPFYQKQQPPKLKDPQNIYQCDDNDHMKTCKYLEEFAQLPKSQQAKVQRLQYVLGQMNN